MAGRPRNITAALMAPQRTSNSMRHSRPPAMIGIIIGVRSSVMIDEVALHVLLIQQQGDAHADQELDRDGDQHDRTR